MNEDAGTNHDRGDAEEDDGNDKPHNAPFDSKRQFSRPALRISPTRITRDGCARVK